MPSAFSYCVPLNAVFFDFSTFSLRERISRGGCHGEYCLLVRDTLWFGEIYLRVGGRVNNFLSDHIPEHNIPSNRYATTP